MHPFVDSIQISANLFRIVSRYNAFRNEFRGTHCKNLYTLETYYNVP